MPASEEARRNQRNRIHVDVFVPDDQARSRIDAALAAGGRIAYDAEAPEWWTLADPEGNEVDIAVSAGREELWLTARTGLEESRTSVDDPSSGRQPTSHERMTGTALGCVVPRRPGAVGSRSAPAGDRACGSEWRVRRSSSRCGLWDRRECSSCRLTGIRCSRCRRGRDGNRGRQGEGRRAWDRGRVRCRRRVRLEQVGRRFDTVLDSGLFHTFDADERLRYAASLASVTEHGGTLYVVVLQRRWSRSRAAPRQPGTADCGVHSGGRIECRSDRAGPRSDDVPRRCARIVPARTTNDLVSAFGARMLCPWTCTRTSYHSPSRRFAS